MSEWKKVGTTPIGGNKWKKLELWHFITPQKKEVEFTMTISYDVVIVFGITSDQKVLVIDEYYPVLQKKVCTLVAGVIEGKSPSDTARAELKEEAGYEAENIISLGTKIRGKYNSGKVHFFLATNIVQTGEPQLEDEEDIENKLISIEELKKLLINENFQDIMEVLGAYMALDYLEKHKNETYI